MIRVCTFIFLLILSVYPAYSQHQNDTINEELSLLFIGDIMGHGGQVRSAYNEETDSYDYNHCFQYIKDEIGDADYTIANLEVTLAGPPFKGYPQFSSPDALAVACQNAGIDVLVTANNHSCDRGGEGIVRTIDVLDSLKIMHTGTFRNQAERDENHPLIIESNCFRIAILNYTYGTNGLPFPAPTIVNLIEKDQMKKDLDLAKTKNVDKIIVVTHWGSEYKRDPSTYQIDHGKFLFENGADIIIGAHPHVLEKMVWEKRATDSGKDELIVYSLGNFVSNQRKPRTDGGAMIKMTLKKEGDQSYIKDAGYILTWVYLPTEDGKKKYYILPASKYESNKAFFDSVESYNTMQAFIKDARELFDGDNENVPEYIYSDSTKTWMLEE